jgi:hypothetical protein
MQIEIADDDYEKLLDLLFLAGRVLTAHKEEDPRTAPYLAVMQRLYARALEAGRPELVTFDPELNHYQPARPMADSSEVRRLLDEFADETFWHELVFRFTERDVERQAGGREKTMLLTEEERFKLEVPLEERYLQEFSEHGIDRLEIVEHLALRGRPHKTSD